MNYCLGILKRKKIQISPNNKCGARIGYFTEVGSGATRNTMIIPQKNVVVTPELVKTIEKNLIIG